MIRTSVMMSFLLVAGCAPQAGDSEQEFIDDVALAATTIKTVPGIWVHPESTRWSPYHGRWLVSNTMIGSPNLKDFDGRGWLGHVTTSGTALFPNDTGGLSDISQWQHLDTAGYSQWGGGWDTANPYGYLANPVGLAVNPITGTIYVVEAGWLNAAGDPDLGVGGAPSVVVFDKNAVFVQRIRLAGVQTANDIAWAQTPGQASGVGSLYVTDSGFGALAKVVQVTSPDGGATSVSTFVSLANYPGANAVVLDPLYNSGGGARPHLVISTLGSDLSGASANGKVLTVDLTSKVVKGVTLTGAGAPAKLFADTMAIRDIEGIFGGKRWVIGDLLTRKLYDVVPSTGAATLYADLSGTIPQLGGGSCAPRVGTAASLCTWASFGWSAVVQTQ